MEDNMKKIVASVLGFVLACLLTPIAPAQSSDIPRLEKKDGRFALIVDGKPFLVLGGQIGNSSAWPATLPGVWSAAEAMHANTVEAPVYWEQIEPAKGTFDFSNMDLLVTQARQHHLHLVLLWFGTWKNGQNHYVPEWIKSDPKTYPREENAYGKLLDVMSPNSPANLDADKTAFAALLGHIKSIDAAQHTVIMIQVENEVGLRGDSRDRSPAANQAFAAPVPKDLMDYLQQHKDSLIPEFRQVWEKAGFKTSGTWEEVFGKGAAEHQIRMTDQIFMAWHFAHYVGRVAEAGKAEYPIPMYMNAALYRIGMGPQLGRGQTGGQSGAPMDYLMDVWRAGAPGIDMLSPDIYGDGSHFAQFCDRYSQSGNPLFIPETGGARESKSRALYVFGRHDGIGFSPFGIDREDRLGYDPDLSGIYDLVSQLEPLIVEHQGDGTMSAVLMEPNDPPQKIRVGNYTLEVTFWPIRYKMPLIMPGEPPPRPPPPAAAIFIATGPDEYFVAGSGVKVTFSPNTPGPPRAGLGTVEEGTFVNGRWVPGVRLAGDDTGQGEDLFETQRHMGIQRVALYRYQ
jgi:hypothetical protein